jgi:hypothetical protein
MPTSLIHIHLAPCESRLAHQCLRLTLRDLGVRASPDVAPPSLGDYLNTKGAAR